jgi:pyruvate dehydrogenase (quinone)
MPPSLSFDLIRDFGIFMVKAVLNGRGDEIVDLARVNLKR